MQRQGSPYWLGSPKIIPQGLGLVTHAQTRFPSNMIPTQSDADSSLPDSMEIRGPWWPGFVSITRAADSIFLSKS